MMNGASTLEGYMPDIDATSSLESSMPGTIVGKSTCEYFCLSGGPYQRRRTGT